MRWPRVPPTPAVVAVTAAGTLPPYLTAALAVLAGPELGFGPGGLGVLVAAQFGMSAVTTWSTGRFADRMPPTRLMRASATIAAASMAVSAAVPSFALLIPAMLMGGLANGIGQPASNALLSTAVDRRHQGRAYGLKQAAIPLSVLVAGVLVPTVAVPLGWRAGYLTGAVLAFGVAALVPAGPGRRAAAASDAPAPRRLPLSVLALGTALGAAGGNVLGGFLIPYAVDTGLTPGQAGALAAVGSGTGVVTRVLLGEHADRRGGRHLARVAVMLALGSVGFLLMSSGAGPVVLVAGTFLAYVTGWSWAGLLGYAIALAHPGAAGRATAITQGGVGIGGALGPLVAGVVVGEYGFTGGWLLAAGCTAAAAVVVVWGRSLLLADPRIAAVSLAEQDRGRDARRSGR